MSQRVKMSVFLIPHFANTAVSPAKNADKIPITIHVKNCYPLLFMQTAVRNVNCFGRLFAAFLLFFSTLLVIKFKSIFSGCLRCCEFYAKYSGCNYKYRSSDSRAFCIFYTEKRLDDVLYSPNTSLNAIIILLIYNIKNQ